MDDEGVLMSGSIFRTYRSLMEWCGIRNL